MTSQFSDRHSQRANGVFASSFADPAFEPQSGFNFGESSEDELRNMQKNLASLQGVQGEHAFFHPANSADEFGHDQFSTLHSGTASGEQSTYDQSIIDPATVWGNISSPSEDLEGMMSAPSLQSQIVQSRGRSVGEHFGQITPPEDSTPDEYTSTKKRSGEASRSKGASQSSVEKSERARNAAIQRHSRSKRARKDSNQDHESASGSGDDVTEEKKEKYREKNRLAAAKCRAKKKENIETIEDEHRALSLMNNTLKKQLQTLRLELTSLRTHALYHQGCHCEIHQYNMNQAKRVALNADGIGSPEDTNMMLQGNQSSATAASRRSKSFAQGMAPSPCIGQHAAQRHHSFAAPSNYAFAAVTTPDDMMSMQTQQDGDQQSQTYSTGSFGSHLGGRSSFES